MPSPKPIAATFPLFPLLPGELRDLIWSSAAAAPPQIHFLRRLEPRHDKWLDPDMILVPDRGSGALNTVHLSLACRDARAAVLRQQQQRRHAAADQRTILSVSPFQGAPATYLSLDLGADVICFGAPAMGVDEADAALGWSESNHVVFGAGRRLAVRYQPAWDVAKGREQTRRHAWPDCLHLAGRDGGPPPFCARCLANVLRRFDELREFWLIVDVPGERRAEDEGIAGVEDKRAEFHSFDKTYFEVGRDGMGGMQGPLDAMTAIRESLMASPRFSYVPPWAAKLKYGLLGWRQDAWAGSSRSLEEAMDWGA